MTQVALSTAQMAHFPNKARMFAQYVMPNVPSVIVHLQLNVANAVFHIS